MIRFCYESISTILIAYYWRSTRQRSLFACIANFFTHLYLNPSSHLSTFFTLFKLTPSPPPDSTEVLTIFAEVIWIPCERKRSTASLIYCLFESLFYCFWSISSSTWGSALYLQTRRLTKSLLTLNLRATSFWGSKSTETAWIISTFSFNERSVSFLFLYLPATGVFYWSIASKSFDLSPNEFVFFVESLTPLRERCPKSGSASNSAYFDSSPARYLIYYLMDVNSSPSWMSLCSDRAQSERVSSLCILWNIYGSNIGSYEASGSLGCSRINYLVSKRSEMTFHC